MVRASRDPFPLVILLIILAAVIAYAANYTLQSTYRDIDCQGITCPEGQFCQQNSCKDIYYK